MKMTYKTKMRKNAGSMITVVPSALINLLKMEHGDTLIWTADVTGEGAIITVAPQKESVRE
jgi:hypothetical protein